MLRFDLHPLRVASFAAFCISLRILPAAGEHLKILHAFTGGADGGSPWTNLAPDQSGNVYGTTSAGGATTCDGAPVGCGTIFKLSRSGQLTTLHAFTGGAEGQYPTTGVSLLHGTLYGGAIDNSPGHYGMVFSIKVDGSGFSDLHEFSGADGQYTIGLLQASINGGEFGLTQQGGRSGQGTLYYLGPFDRFEVAHNFAGGRSDGGSPNALVEDAQGHLFGSTIDGGGCVAEKSGCGVIFEYDQHSQTYSILYSFQDGDDGSVPLLGSVAPDGTIYGVSLYGGAQKQGALFALSPSGSGYQFAVLAPITSKYRQDSPLNPPVLSPDGALIGATSYGGIYQLQDGQYSITYSSDAYSLGQYLVPPANPTTILGASYSGNPVQCTLPGNQDCGYLFGVNP